MSFIKLEKKDLAWISLKQWTVKFSTLYSGKWAIPWHSLFVHFQGRSLEHLRVAAVSISFGLCGFKERALDEGLPVGELLCM